MKKILLFFIVSLQLVVLSSCKINMIDRQYEVSWWVVAIPSVVSCAVVLLWAGKHISKKKYICPKCNAEFYPKWWKASLSLHINDDRYFTCPVCKKRSFCHISYNQKEK